MQKRRLGRSGLEVSSLAFGGNVFGWTADEPASMRLLDRFVDEGFNFIDTADMYSRWVPGHQGGESEIIIGKWLKKSGKRDGLIKAGKVRAIGASNYSAERFEEALAVSKKNNLPRYESMQPNYNLYDRADYEAGLQKVCVRNDVGVISYFSLASGFLTGKYRSEADLAKSPRGQMVKKYLNEKGHRILDALDSVAKETSSTPARVALAWLMAQPGITAPIASATSLRQLEDLFAATRLKLDPAKLEQLDAASR